MYIIHIEKDFDDDKELITFWIFNVVYVDNV